MRRIDQRVQEFAARQSFLVTRPQVLLLGGSDGGIHRRLRSGQWMVVQAGVYQVDRRRSEWEEQLFGAILAAGPETLASHRAALVLWGLDGISSAPVEITAPFTHGPVPAQTIVHRTRRPAEPASIRGIPVTTVERTLLDCCALLGQLAATKAFESAFRRRLTTLDRMYGFLGRRAAVESRGPGWPGGSGATGGMTRRPTVARRPRRST